VGCRGRGRIRLIPLASAGTWADVRRTISDDVTWTRAAKGQAMNLHRAASFVLLVVVPLVVWAAWTHARSVAARRDFQRLLRGDSDVALAAAMIDVQWFGMPKRQIVLEDPVAMRYLTERLQAARTGQSTSGSTYYMRLRLSTGLCTSCCLDLPAQGDQMTIGFPIDTLGDPTYYRITLREPVPLPVSRAVSDLRKAAEDPEKEKRKR